MRTDTLCYMEGEEPPEILTEIEAQRRAYEARIEVYLSIIKHLLQESKDGKGKSKR